jgi:hypothetical protein
VWGFYHHTRYNNYSSGYHFGGHYFRDYQSGLYYLGGYYFRCRH